MQKTVIAALVSAAVLTLAAVVFTGCTNAEMAQYTSLGTPGEIVCYSGGKVIYEGKSTGKISTEHSSDGWFFQEAGTNKLIRVSGDCVIKN